jgi:predicted RNA binding protein YcfA (HicA-like mRNA interferase family)
MPPFGPVRRSELVRALRSLGFDGPYSGGKHQFMVRGSTTLRIPNPHQTDIGRDLLSRILRQAGIDHDAWENA